jgi:hypothetical protein
MGTPLAALHGGYVEEHLQQIGGIVTEGRHRELTEGQPVLAVIDIQGSAPRRGCAVGDPVHARLRRRDGPRRRWSLRPARAPSRGVFQEAHRRDLVDFGRELDGAEGVHLLEGDPGTDIDSALDVRPDDYVIRTRRYSCVCGTDFEILLKWLRADTLILIGGHTNVCVHYSSSTPTSTTTTAGWWRGCVAGSSRDAHDAALRAMEYLQTGARRRMAETFDAFAAFRSRSAALDHQPTA